MKKTDYRNLVSGAVMAGAQRHAEGERFEGANLLMMHEFSHLVGKAVRLNPGAEVQMAAGNFMEISAAYNAPTATDQVAAITNGPAASTAKPFSL